MSGFGAKRGFKREVAFAKLINENHKFRQNLQTGLSEMNISNGRIRSARVMNDRFKADVKVLINENETEYELGFSLKAADANFNQLDRRWLKDWADVTDMPVSIKEMIQSSLDRKLINSRDIFILPEQESYIIPFLEGKKHIIFRELLTKGDEQLKAFVAYDESKNKWFLSRMEDIFNFLLTEPLSTSKNGVLMIGDCLSLQRKGGDGNIKNPPKSSPLHPSNHLQFKIKPLNIINKVKSIEIIV